LILPSTYDSIFQKHAGRLPVAYLRALGKRESDLNPRSSDGAAWGLLQVIPAVLKSYNERHGTSHNREELLNPDTNVQIAADLLNRIVVAFGKHPSRNLKENWANPEFVKLVTAGWNSGYSEAGGVGRVADYLEQRGIPVTHDSVFKHAGSAGATEHLSNPAKQSWQRGVAALYFTQRDRPKGSFALITVALAGFAIWGVLRNFGR
jgi:hypothetical protein